MTDLAQIFILLLVDDRRPLAFVLLREMVAAVRADHEDAAVFDVRHDFVPGVPLGLFTGIDALAVIVDPFRGLILDQRTLPAINVWLHEFTLSMKPHTYLFLQRFLMCF